MADTGSRIRGLRHEQGIPNQKELARRVGVSESTIKAIEGGHREPRIGLLTRIAKALNVDIRYLLCLSNERGPFHEGPCTDDM